MLKGIGISPGIAMGQVVVLRRFDCSLEDARVEPQDVERELDRLGKSIEIVSEQIEAIMKTCSMDEKENCDILETHLQILNDPAYIGKIKKLVSEDLMRPEGAIQKVTEEFVSLLESMESEVFQERAADVRDVCNRLLKWLLGFSEDINSIIKKDCIIVADDITPSEVVEMDNSLVRGIVMGSGGKTCHVAVITRGLGIPAVGGLGLDYSLIEEGDYVIVDGDEGIVISSPEEDEQREYLSRQRMFEQDQRDLEALRDFPAATADGVRFVDVGANITSPQEINDVIRFGAKGIGLYRTEFLYMKKKNWPNEETQYQEYKEVFKKAQSLPVIVRTLDIGGDKNLAYMKIPHEENPFLGLRALRLCFAKPDVFLTQLRAILRAAVYGTPKIMFPMVSNLGELLEAKSFLEKAKSQLSEEGVDFMENTPVGIMIEIPSAAIIVESLVHEVDFFSIGTNDLIQYTLAADRMNKYVANLYEPFHPAILFLIKHVIDIAHKYGKWVGMCGEMAGNLKATELLLGLGLDEFSMSASSIPRFKKHIASLNYEKAVALAQEAVKQHTAEQVRELITERKKAS
jgi:phosphotransferase system enzyme I (PtsI)